MLEQLIASLLASSTLLQEMITSCSRLGDNWEQAVRTHLVENETQMKKWDEKCRQSK
jgi:hypothetical protein